MDNKEDLTAILSNYSKIKLKEIITIVTIKIIPVIILVLFLPKIVILLLLYFYTNLNPTYNYNNFINNLDLIVYTISFLIILISALKSINDTKIELLKKEEKYKQMLCNSSFISEWNNSTYLGKSEYYKVYESESYFYFITFQHSLSIEIIEKNKILSILMTFEEVKSKNNSFKYFDINVIYFNEYGNQQAFKVRFFRGQIKNIQELQNYDAIKIFNKLYIFSKQVKVEYKHPFFSQDNKEVINEWSASISK